MTSGPSLGFIGGGRYVPVAATIRVEAARQRGRAREQGRRGSSLLDEIVREGKRRMPAAALEDEVNAYIAESTDERAARGRHLVAA
jgi:hypothetical protein